MEKRCVVIFGAGSGQIHINDGGTSAAEIEADVILMAKKDRRHGDKRPGIRMQMQRSLRH